MQENENDAPRHAQIVDPTGSVTDAEVPKLDRADGSPLPAAAAVASRPEQPGRGVGGSRELAGVAVLVVLALICAGLIAAVVMKTRDDARAAARDAAAYQPPVLASPSPGTTSPRVAMITDGLATQARRGVSTSERWPALLAADLDGSVELIPSPGSGYVTKSTSGSTFGTSASKVAVDAQTVVFFGGAADAGAPDLSVAKAATDAIGVAAKRAEGATLIVVGPVSRSGASNAEFSALRSTLRGAARIAEVTWIDPVSSGWLPDRVAAKSATSLTAADQETIATKLRAVVEKATD